MRPALVIVALWPLWAISWFGTAWWAAPTEKKVDSHRELAYRVVLAVGSVALFIPAHGYQGPLRLWHVGWIGAWGCVAVMILGFSFCWWARIHLGRLWSMRVTKKEGHHVVDTGPYGVVRHPIYAGIIAAAIGTAIAKGTIFGMGGAGLLTIGLLMKARLEEAWLRAELGTEYEAYRKRVPMLVPFAPR
jgi:protein-S-isoprenylcysteine O-methyltransferase Ste14